MDDVAQRDKSADLRQRKERKGKQSRAEQRAERERAMMKTIFAVVNALKRSKQLQPARRVNFFEKNTQL